MLVSDYLLVTALCHPDDNSITHFRWRPLPSRSHIKPPDREQASGLVQVKAIIDKHKPN